MIQNSKFINSKDTYTLHSQEIYRSPKEVNYAGITDLNSEASYKLDNTINVLAYLAHKNFMI